MTNVPPQEIEAKFLVHNIAWVEQLVAAPALAAGYDLGDAAEICLTDTYLDTPDCRLLRQGYGLRVRVTQDERLVTLKSRRVVDTASIYRRSEVEESFAPELSPTLVAGWPAGVAEALLPLLGGQSTLHPLCVLRQRRVKRSITAMRRITPNRRSVKCVTVGELSLDEVCICAVEGGPTLARYHELEIELARGVDETELHALVAALQTELQTQPSPQSKLEFALTIVGGHPAGAPEDFQGIQCEMHMAEACRLIWREQITAMLLNEAGVRFSANPEFVHDMRVATRRARAAARLFGDYLRTKAIRRHLKALRQTARLLGAVRDLDVAIDKLDRFARRSGKRTAAAVAGMLDEWRARRAAAHSELLAWLDSRRYARFVANFRQFCDTPNLGAVDYTPKPGQAPTPHQVRHVMPSMILNRFEAVRSFETLFEGDGEVRIESLHLLRIECKYLRYNLEFVNGLLGPNAARLIAELRRLQDLLGNLNDAAVSKAMLANAQAGQPVPGIERYLQAQEKTIRRLSERIEGDLRQFTLLANRKRLALAMAWI